jgi:hypothetical protein
MPLIIGAVYYAFAGRHKFAAKSADPDYAAVATSAASSGE